MDFRSLVGVARTGRMKRGSGRFDLFKTQQQGRQRSIQAFICIVFLYVFLVNVHIPSLLFDSGDKDMMKVSDNALLPRNVLLEDDSESKISGDGNGMTDIVFRQSRNTLRVRASAPLNLGESASFRNTNKMVSGLVFDFSNNTVFGQDRLQKAAKSAWEAGLELWNGIQSENVTNENSQSVKKRKKCPSSISISGDTFNSRRRTLVLPCGLTLGSHITVVGKPKFAHREMNPKIRSAKRAMVSQFVLELQGLKTADGEDPPRILHLNPRLKGDWSGKPVIEMNTCYRMQWGTPQRCEGWQSAAHEQTVDGQVKCEKWNAKESDLSDHSKSTWWLDQLIGRKKVNADWPFPFAENKLFILTLSAGFEGYHLNVNGRHISSFPYRTNFALEDATGLWLNGDVDVRSVYTASLPTSNPHGSTQVHLEMEHNWKAPPILDQPVELFIGILSAGNHFAERMAVRKSWMQHNLIRSSRVVARFFVALHAQKEVNLELKKEAEYFGDTVIVPYMDNYDLVVLKTVAICEYGVVSLSARAIMKCDDDTFVRVDVVHYGAKRIGKESFYAGNINYHHKPLRQGKWAVTNAEWAEEDYPPYANGPGYLISADIAEYIVTEFEKNELRLFKMEDVSMGVWVEKFNSKKPVKYVHSMKFCQSGCIQNYYTAHYQSPRQMMCLWQKLMHYGRPQCCNM